jgi:hypothetical protein
MGCALTKDQRDLPDRREYRRFRTREGTFAVLRNHSIRLGQVVDISRGGLAFQYIPDEQAFAGSCAVDILLTGKGLCVSGISSRVVSDFEIEDMPPMTTIPVRRCGVRFESLESGQESQLQGFIQSHTTGEV